MMRRCVLLLSLMLALAAPVWAQSPTPPAPPPTCEVQLADTQKALIQLRKSDAQFRFQAAAMEELVLGLQERVRELSKPASEEKRP